MLMRLLLLAVDTHDSIITTWSRDPTDRAGWLSRSCWSLALVALWRRELTHVSNPTVWFPDYFCDQSLEPLRRVGSNIKFYPIKEDLSPDYQWLRQHEKCHEFDILVLVHYFGEGAKSADAVEFCKSRQIWLVEDATHVLKPTGDIGSLGDFVIYSPHKLIAIPDGALLIARKSGPSALTDELLSCLGHPADWWRKLNPRQLAFRITLLNFAWLLKRISQKLGVRFEAISSVSIAVREISYHPTSKHSKLAKKLLVGAINELDNIVNQRRRNKFLLDYVVRNSSLSDYLSGPEKKPSDRYVPYISYFRRKRKLSALVGYLKTHGITGLTWPDLPKSVLSAPIEHAEAIELYNSRYFIPIYEPLDRRTVSKLVTFESPVSSTNIDIAKWLGSKDEWNFLLGQMNASNIPQMWEYGEAKSSSEGWVVKRFLISSDGKTIGCFQLLTKRYLGFIRVNRINRGPLFCVGIQTHEMDASYQKIRNRFGNIKAGKILFWAPESLLDGRSLAYFRCLGFYERSSRSWRSSVIDLTLSDQIIFNKLKGKWRNSLRDAQRRNLVLTISESDSDYTSLLNRCADILQSRDVKFPKSTYILLRHMLKEQCDRDLHLTATSGGDVVASIYIVTHGISATYLLGWNSEQGRNMRAHHFLLWESIRQLKFRSIKCFDLGGIDELLTPGIASFKSGMGGVSYELLGEGVCL